MGMNLHNQSGEYHHFSMVVWPKLLELAESYGWEPLGTAKNPNHDEFYSSKTWNGNYHANMGQVVLPEDALALADALEKTLDDIPDDLEVSNLFIELEKVNLEDINSPDLKKSLTAFSIFGQCNALVINPHLTPFEMFGGPNKVIVRDFVAFCRKGGFEIW